MDKNSALYKGAQKRYWKTENKVQHASHDLLFLNHPQNINLRYDIG